MENEFENIIRENTNQLVYEYQHEGLAYNTKNGPYNDPENLARQLSHLIVMLYYEITYFKKKEYVDAMIMMGKDLINCFSDNGLIRMREKTGKDSCNGVIGHAWVLEALACLYRYSQGEIYKEYGDKIIANHMYNKDYYVWLIPDNSKVDTTFNHQLWYAACMGEYAECTGNTKQIEIVKGFLNNCYIFQTANNGRIRHLIKPIMHSKDALKNIVKNIHFDINGHIGKASMVYKEAGYHAFNLLAFAKLYVLFPELSIWNSRKFKRTLMYLNNPEYDYMLETKKSNLDITKLWKSVSKKEINIYGYPYNAVGFEIRTICKIFGIDDEELIRVHEAKQWKYTFDERKKRFCVNCEDEAILNFRTYEYYLQYSVKKEKGLGIEKKL